MQRLLSFLFALTCLFVHAQGDELTLVAVTHPDCHVCARWKDEILEQYTILQTTHGFPELNVMSQDDLKNRLWVYRNLGMITALPTFFLMKNGEAVGDFKGYSDPEYFIEMMGLLMEGE
ncbi:hypothetical protein MMH89_01625 [Candidatus Comchoanobacter bicostacola]|uniref:Uncharacterized protein n=1 Tax=Candidatus Comchoanobacter bicostacola TaxID=2919598 RepID=A0ABY5DM94_9GAMM|nr:hypothetical protein [Candidatus Comchoanobacter bicostacola]UTC24851.1 hypothetical protein MMH89_01625 [Candidatus Comchoanobacter bicostacola]